MLSGVVMLSNTTFRNRCVSSREPLEGLENLNTGLPWPVFSSLFLAKMFVVFGFVFVFQHLDNDFEMH